MIEIFVIVKIKKEVLMSDFFEKVKKVLDEEIRPTLQMDGGDAELVSAKDGTVELKLKGACSGCPMAMLTLIGFVEQKLKEKIEEVKEVVSV